MSHDFQDDRSSQAKAYHWVSRVISVSLEMVVPGLLGLGLDAKLGTGAVFTLLGFVIGLPLGIWHLLKMTSRDEPGHRGQGNEETRR